MSKSTVLAAVSRRLALHPRKRFLVDPAGKRKVANVPDCDDRHNGKNESAVVGQMAVANRAALEKQLIHRAKTVAGLLDPSHVNFHELARELKHIQANIKANGSPVAKAAIKKLNVTVHTMEPKRGAKRSNAEIVRNRVEHKAKADKLEKAANKRVRAAIVAGKKAKVSDLSQCSLAVYRAHENAHKKSSKRSKSAAGGKK